MTDLSSGLFALGGALIGAAGTQVTAIINAVSKSKVRKAKSDEAAKTERAALRRPLYTTYLEQLHVASDTIGWLRRNHPETRAVPNYSANSSQEVLRPVRDSSVRVQIDGSDAAKNIASEVLAGISELMADLRANHPVTPQVLTRAVGALTKAETDMIEAARQDIGG